MKKYITYQRVKKGEYLFLDPNTNEAFENATNDSRFYETPYEHNGVFLAYVEHPNITEQETIEQLIEEYKSFHFTFITEYEANVFLAKIGDVTVSEFIFTDNRPVEILL